MNAEKILKENGFKVIQTIEKDNDMFPNNFIMFEADLAECIMANQILSKNNFEIIDCGIQVRIVDGILERPCGQITFLEN